MLCELLSTHTYHHVNWSTISTHPIIHWACALIGVAVAPQSQVHLVFLSWGGSTTLMFCFDCSFPLTIRRGSMFFLRSLATVLWESLESLGTADTYIGLTQQEEICKQWKCFTLSMIKALPVTRKYQPWRSSTIDILKETNKISILGGRSLKVMFCTHHDHVDGSIHKVVPVCS